MLHRALAPPAALLPVVLCCAFASARAATYDLADGPLDATILGGVNEGIPSGGAETALAFGDIDGDGESDLVLGAGRGEGGLDPFEGGRVYVLHGPIAAGALRDLSAASADITILGADRMQLGTDVAVGDFDGDGNDDIAAGAAGFGRSSFPTGTRGSVLIFFGPLARGTTLDLDADAPGWRLDATDLDAMGSPLDAGDFNGDGIDDLVVGLHFASGPGNLRRQAGEVHVYLGPLGRGMRTTVGATPGDIVVLGRIPTVLIGDNADDLGIALAHGDLTGDGIDDLVIGASHGNADGGARRDAGEAHVLFSPLTPRILDLESAAADATAWGHGSPSLPTREGDVLGISVAVADVSGDGIGDLIVGGSGGDGSSGVFDRAGIVIVAHGPLVPGQVIDAADPATLATRIHGATDIDWIGDISSIAAGDMDGSGFAGMVLGRYARDGVDGTRPNSGEATVLCAPVPQGEIDLAMAEREPRIFGREPSDRLGRGVAIADVSGDGVGDVLLGASGSDGGAALRSASGELAILFGDPCERPPACDAGGPYVIGCPGAVPCAEGLVLALDGSRSRARGAAIASYEWSIDCGGSIVTASGERPDACVDPSCGSTCAITLTVRDVAGLSSTCATTLALDDAEPPVVTASTQVLGCLWAPNHGVACWDASRLRPDVRDACSDVTWRLGPCTSSQADDANGTGDGHFPDDCVVSGDGTSACLRAERDGTGRTGRSYTLTVVATDACGNVSAPTPVGVVRVEHDRREQRSCEAGSRTGMRRARR